MLSIQKNESDINIYKKLIYKIFCINFLIIILRIIHFLGYFCFFISGIVILIHEKNNIVQCTYPYYIWSLIIIILFFIPILIIAQKKVYTFIIYSKKLFISSIFTSILFGIGYEKVILSTNNCEINGIENIVKWSYLSIIYCGILSFSYLLSSLGFYKLSK